LRPDLKLLLPGLAIGIGLGYVLFRCCTAFFAASSFMNTAMSLDYSGDQLFVPNIVRAIGQALLLTPLSAISLGSVAPHDAAAASGIANMMHNLGGAVGTAVLATIVTKREQFHSNIIGQAVDLGREEVRVRIASLTDYFMAHGVTDPAGARHQALIALGKTVKQQASLWALAIPLPWLVSC
jgi:MFS transporter, DHA2 family, multidrug resistance protein